MDYREIKTFFINYYLSNAFWHQTVFSGFPQIHTIWSVCEAWFSGQVSGELLRKLA